MRRLSPDDLTDSFIKLIIIGNSGVGKTNILMRFCDKKFKDSYIATIGVDFKLKAIDVEGINLKLQLWDTAGQERYKNLTKTYYKGAAGIILTFALNDRKSFDDAQSWMKQISENVESDCRVVLIGNKCDLPKQERQVAPEEIDSFCKRFRVVYYEVSAKDGTNIDNAFVEMATAIKRERYGGLMTEPSNFPRSCNFIQFKKISLLDNEKTPSRRCC